MKNVLTKLMLFILLITACFFNNYSKEIIATSSGGLEFFNGEIEHIFIHCLVAYPEIAFKETNSMKSAYEKDCITSEEFCLLLNELYKNNYVLVDINSTFKVDENGVAEKQKVNVPKGKKPLVLSVDDVVYDHKKAGKGMVDKIIVDSNGNLATSTVINCKEEIAYDKEFVCILENFISSHPDFSVKNARATINLTGFDGILGYRTQTSNKTNREEQIINEKKVVQKLKEKGYNFACHSYGHYHMKQISLENFKREIDAWNEEVVPLIGKTNIYVYPYGEWEIMSGNKLSEKQQLLIDDGFKLFCGVGIKNFYSYMPYNKKISQKILFMDRAPIDGTTLTTYAKDLSNLIDASSVLRREKYKNI